MRLTKSRFVAALTCPTKLFYLANTDYANQSAEDTFLAALAEGGFQVGELAKLYFPTGINIETLDVIKAVDQTSELLRKESVIIFEAAIRYQNCFVRVDILEKKGNSIRIHEVKAKSFDGIQDSNFLKTDGSPKASWKKYLYDVAFQKWVCSRALSNHIISAHLMLADKSKKITAAGLNQKFKIQEINGRKKVKVEDNILKEHLTPRILTSVNVDNICADIFTATKHGLEIEETFDQMVQRFSFACEHGQLIEPQLGTHCGQCEFLCSNDEKLLGKKDGRSECFKLKLGIEPSVFEKPTIFNLWNFREKKKFINEGIIQLSDLNEGDVNPSPNDRGLSNSERQWIQVQKAKDNDDTVYLDHKGLRSEMDSWVYPLHFIDFETTMAAIPFGANQTPYEGIAFQFSHHTVDEEGNVKHAGQFLNVEPGYFPNYDFVRALKDELSQDHGSIFRYSNHENTYLNIVLEQLRNDAEPPQDKDDLIIFIKSITKSPKKSNEIWIGERVMIDLLEVVKSFYFDPRTNGSNSIKYILPSILNRSEYLKSKYSTPIYGSASGIPSTNFKSWTWIRNANDGSVADPYTLLPKLFKDKDEHQVLLLSQDDELKNGGAALMAYARMQFEAMSDYEHNELKTALLKYCELDTLAMVMIYEAWKHELLD
ncbi:DUF2779 domain-containing protein [bacterium]|nr:DUF2779 domain-containing protein [bacterium]